MNVERPSNKIFKYKEVQAMSDAATKYSDKFEQDNIVDALSQAFEEADSEPSAKDRQEGGSHYQGAIQPIDFIMSNNLSFCQGNAIKYVFRYKNKGGIEDLKKAKHYIDFMIEELENEV